ncbi:hypothetical protein GCM10010303_82130 [Streptomyces purpurascens]|nr:hypothetical protein GCM10010303_82130 [Streptomyces purpurascens]
MFVEIVFVGLPIDRDDVEEALETAFELDGEVTGAGSGMGRCHLDLEIAESRTRPRPWSGSGRCCPNWSRGLRDVERQRMIKPPSSLVRPIGCPSHSGCGRGGWSWRW